MSEFASSIQQMDDPYRHAANFITGGSGAGQDGTIRIAHSELDEFVAKITIYVDGTVEVERATDRGVS